MSDTHVNRQPIPTGIRDDEDILQRRTLRDYYIMLRERMWIALPLALILSIGYGYWKSREVPRYSATATLQFEKPQTIVTAQGVVDPSVRSDIDINTYIQILQSGQLRNAVILSFTPEEQKILLRPAMKNLLPGQPPPAFAGQIGTVTASPVAKSYLISINVTHEDPEAAEIVANRYVDQFMKYILGQSSSANDFAEKFLVGRVEELRKDSEAAQAKLQKYMSDNNLVSLDKSLDIISASLQTVGTQRTTAMLDLDRIKNIKRQIDEYRASNHNLLEIEYIAGHAPIPALRAQLADLEQKKAALLERYLDRYPKVVEITGQIEQVKSVLKKEIDQAINDLQTSISEREQNLISLNAEYQSRQKDELDLKSKQIDFDSLKQQADSAKANYANILDRLNTTRTTTKLEEKIPLRPLDPATIPGEPFEPNRPQIMRTSIGIGILTFVCVAIGLSFIDDRIKSAWDIENFIGVNLLGIVPDLSGIKAEDKYSLLLNSNAQNSSGVEPFLGIYSAIKIHSKLDFPKSILVTSTIPGEGKTLVSSNLAGCFASHGRKTLLIDCDLRRPMLHRHFKQQNTAGILTWFENGAVLEGNLIENPHLGITPIATNLSLLSSGGRSKSPTSLLEDPKFGELLERLGKEFDLLVVDSPPMGAVTDALLVASRTDEIVYVCRFNRAYRKHIKLFVRTLAEGKNTVLGIVLNGISARRIEYYSNYRYYRSYKKYYGTQA
jgi:capsular exopolysaccharide synthesis family protein